MSAPVHATMDIPDLPILRGRLVGFFGSGKLSDAADTRPAATGAIAASSNVQENDAGWRT